MSSKRPPLMMSTSAPSSAVCTGCFRGSSTRLMQMRIFFVRAATAAAATNGDGR